jgi:GntR family transcriptional regulator, trigonelline degradation regulator
MRSPSFSRESTPFTIAHVAAPVREQVEAQLRQAIVTGHFEPGTRLVERELCTLLGVSRTSLREALRQLEGDGLVMNIPHKGIVVTTITRKTAEEIYEVRAVVEGLAGRLCAEHLTVDLERALKAAMEQIEVAHQAEDLVALIAAKEQFYQVLLAFCGNRTAGVVLQSLHDRIASLRALTLAQPGRAEASVAEMRRILETIVAQDGPAACHACIDHVEQAAQVATAVLRQREYHPPASGKLLGGKACQTP